MWHWTSLRLVLDHAFHTRLPIIQDPTFVDSTPDDADDDDDNDDGGGFYGEDDGGNNTGGGAYQEPFDEEGSGGRWLHAPCHRG